MLSLRAHLFIFLALLAALILLPVAVGLLQAAGMQEAPPAWRLPGLVLVFGLVVALAFSAVPVIVLSVLGFQKAVGNADLAAVKAATARRKLIIWAMWLVMAAGMAIAIPAAIADGMFGPDAARKITGEGQARSEGVLVARPGMTLEEMKRRSTLKLDIASRYGGPAPVVAGMGTFDLEVPGPALKLEGCRYYFVSTASKDPGRIEGMSIGTAPYKLTRAELEAADAALRTRLAAEGWLTGHEVYRTEEDRSLHGGRTEGPEGHIWLKDGVVLNIRGKPIDEATAGFDPAAARIWIQYLDLWSRDGYSGIERYAFAPHADREHASPKGRHAGS